MPICIAGMHRSGTSMISGLLGKTGVYLGGEMDFLPSQKGENPDGFWEHFGFYALNERLLHHLGAGWDMPDLPAGWVARDDLQPFREEASQLIERMRSSKNGSTTWGWKDPRNSVTIQFWKSLLPDLRVVICVRNPLEVAASLQRRNNFSLAASANLWLRYYRNLLDNVPRENRIVTLYEDFFVDPHAELKRLLGALHLSADKNAAAVAAESVNCALHHNQASLEQLLASEINPEIIHLYARLREEAALAAPAVNRNAPSPAPAPPGPESTADDLQRSRFHAETAQREELIRRMTQENAGLRDTLDDLKMQIAAIRNNIPSLQGGDHPYVSNLSTMVERAIAVHGLIAHKRAQFAHLQFNIESTLKETKPMWPRLIRCSNSINSLYRMVKRIRKMGKMSTLQRELNDATFESLGALTHMIAVITGQRGEEYVSPPGLERYAIEKTRMDVNRLMEILRIRLS